MNMAIIPLLLSLLSSSMTPALAADEYQQIETLQRRADKLAFGELGPENYHLAKARTWLDFAFTEYNDKDDSGVISAAIGQAEGLLDALENNQPNITMDTPQQIIGGEAVRPDLWEKINALKKEAKFTCGQRPTAEAEVYMVWSGHEYHESGQSHAASYMRAVEDRIYSAQVAIDNCKESASSPSMEKITLSSDAMFSFNKATLNATALSSLNELAENIKKVNMLEEVVLVGHTDRLRSDGHPERNQLLSEQRAESIKQFLIDKGIPAEKIHASGAGSSQPVVECSSKLSRDKQIACLQPNRRVEITLRGGNAVDENKGLVK